MLFHTVTFQIFITPLLTYTTNVFSMYWILMLLYYKNERSLPFSIWEGTLFAWVGRSHGKWDWKWCNPVWKALFLKISFWLDKILSKSRNFCVAEVVYVQWILDLVRMQSVVIRIWVGSIWTPESLTNILHGVCFLLVEVKWGFVIHA